MELEFEIFFLKMGQSRPLFFVYFRYFFDTISIIQIEKSVDGVLGTRTRGRRMVGADETTELWRPPKSLKSYRRRACNDPLRKGKSVERIIRFLQILKKFGIFLRHVSAFKV